MSNQTNIRDRIELTIRRRIDARDDEFCVELIDRLYSWGCIDIRVHYMQDLDVLFDDVPASEILSSIDMRRFNTGSKYFVEGDGRLYSWNEYQVIGFVKNHLDQFVEFCYRDQDQFKDLFD